MKKHYTILLVLSTMLCYCVVSKAQSTVAINTQPGPSGSEAGPLDSIVDLGFKKERQWRTTGAIYTLSGTALVKMFTGNLLNTLQGQIPGLTVVTGSGEPGYDSPVLYVRGQTSWNISGNQ